MDEIKLQQIRNIRSGLLLQSDWTQGNDSPLTNSKKAEWRTYRQQLRDFPATVDLSQIQYDENLRVVLNVSWPEKPQN